MSKLKKVNIKEMRDAAARASGLLKTLGNEKRLMVLCHLAAGEASVGDLGAALEIEQAPLSQQLARLRSEGLVQTCREAQTIYYSLAGDEASRVIALLYDLYCAPPTKRQYRKTTAGTRGKTGGNRKHLSKGIGK